MSVVVVPDNVGLVLIVVGIVLMLLSLLPTSFRASLLQVGEVILAVGVILFVVLLLL